MTANTTKLRDIAQGTGTTVAEAKAPKDFPTMLIAYKEEIARALPKHLSGERLARIALTCFRQNPALNECAPKSIFAAVIVAAQLGLEPGIMGQAYLVPYWNERKKRKECQLIPGWQGMTDLVARAGRASVWTGAVFQGDEFDYALGDRPFVTHKPSGADEEDKNLTHVYAIGRIKGAEWPVVEVWPVAKATRHRDRWNKVGDKHYSYKNFEMYARKVALLQVLKYMPKSVELANAVDLEFLAQRGAQNLHDAKEVIEGTWTPDTDDDDPASAATGGNSEPQGAQQQDPQRVNATSGLE